MPYQQLTSVQRSAIGMLHKLNYSIRKIALMAEVSPSTISREIHRNKCKLTGEYAGAAAQKLSVQRRIATNRIQLTKITAGTKLWTHIVNKITIDKWSPQQISGRMKLDWDKLHQTGSVEHLEYQVSHETIYQWMHSLGSDKNSPDYPTELELKNKLTLTLRYNKGKYRRRHGTRQRREECEAMKKKRIDTRPEIVETRQRVGDWEGDTIVGKEKTQHILTHVERRSGYLLADKLNQATAEQTQRSTLDRFQTIPTNKKHTLTYDNGVQFSLHQGTEQRSGIPIFFAYPYHSWERGTNENTNGLLRQYYPKGSPFEGVTQADLDQAVKEINGID